MNLGPLTRGWALSFQLRDVHGYFAYLWVVSPRTHWTQLQELLKISALQGRMHEQPPSVLQHCGHVRVEGMCPYHTAIPALPRVGKRPSKGRSLIQSSEVTVWSIWKLMWKSFIFSAPSWSVFTTSTPLLNLPAPPPYPSEGRTETNQNKLFAWHYWKTCLIIWFPPSSSWLCLTPASFALSEKVKH